MQWTHGLGSLRLDLNQQLGTRSGPFLCSRQFAWRPRAGELSHGGVFSPPPEIFIQSRELKHNIPRNMGCFFWSKAWDMHNDDNKTKGISKSKVELKNKLAGISTFSWRSMLIWTHQPTSMLQNASYISLPFSFLPRHMPYMQRRPRLHVSTTFFATSASLLDVSWSKIPHFYSVASDFNPSHITFPLERESNRKWPSHHPSLKKKHWPKVHLTFPLRSEHHLLMYHIWQKAPVNVAWLPWRSPRFCGPNANLKGPLSLWIENAALTTETLRLEISKLHLFAPLSCKSLKEGGNITTI